MPPSDDDFAALAADLHQLVERVADVENIAMVADALLKRADDDAKRITDVRRALDDLRRHVDQRLDGINGATEALVVRRPDGSVAAKPVSALDVKTILAIVSMVVVPIIVAIISTNG
jgi:hypothetical protein